MKSNASQKVSLGEKLGYSLGDAGANLVFQMMMMQDSSESLRLSQRQRLHTTGWIETNPNVGSS